MVGPGCCPGMPIHEFSRSCLTSLNDENIRYLILSSQYSCIALLRHRLHDPSWALPAGVQKWRYSRNHGFTRFHGKSGSVSFFLLSMCNFMQKIKKILRAVLEKNEKLTNQPTNNCNVDGSTGSTLVRPFEFLIAHGLNILRLDPGPHFGGPKILQL